MCFTDLDVHLTGAAGGYPLAVLLVTRLTMAVTMTVPLLPTVTVTKDDEAYDVDEETDSANNQDHPGVLDGLRFKEPLEGLDRDGETESEQEHGVDQGPNHLGPGEPECVGVRLPGAQP